MPIAFSTLMHLLLCWPQGLCLSSNSGFIIFWLLLILRWCVALLCMLFSSSPPSLSPFPPPPSTLPHHLPWPVCVCVISVHAYNTVSRHNYMPKNTKIGSILMQHWCATCTQFWSSSWELCQVYINGRHGWNEAVDNGDGTVAEFNGNHHSWRVHLELISKISMNSF